MKMLLIASAITLVGSCSNIRYTDRIQNLKDSIVFEDANLINNYANTITATHLSNHVYDLASDKFEGRKAGDIGFDKAAKFVKDYYINSGISSPLGKNIYYQNIPESFTSEELKSTENVLAYIKGTEFPDEVVIISAHLDHLGVKDSLIYYGADDNASGTAAVMEMAKAFQLAKNEGHGPKRSILFLHLAAEEEGLYGSRYYIKHPVFALENTVADLNIDMIGRVDRYHKDQNDYIYVIGADRLSTELHYISEAANDQFTHLTLDYKYNVDNDPNGYYYRSDHYNFARQNIPVIFYFNGEHEDYHEPTDTPDKINYPLLEKRTKLIFTTAWYLANCKNRIVADKAS
jgi:Zn-dependent M28 family amino/carboxypeptidase